MEWRKQVGHTSLTGPRRHDGSLGYIQFRLSRQLRQVVACRWLHLVFGFIASALTDIHASATCFSTTVLKLANSGLAAM